MKPTTLEHFERLLIFFSAIQKPSTTKKEQLEDFIRISGLTEAEARSALDVCILKGFVSDFIEQ